MSKTIRMILYVFSVLAVAAVIALCVRTGMAGPSEDTWSEVSTENQSTDAEESEAVLEPASEQEQKEQSEGVTSEEEEIQTQETTEEGTNAGELPAGAGETTVLFTGDVLFGNSFKTGYDARGILGVVSEELQRELQAADILMINNEFPFSDRGTPMEDKQYTFQCSPGYVTALNEMGVDIVSLANNHTLDFGKEALSDTFATLDGAGILYGGAGETVERAEKLQVIEVNGKRFGFIAVSRVIPDVSWKVEFSTPGLFSCYDETRLIELVAEADETCDFVAVYPHWGVEYAEYPEEYQRKIAQKCMEAGADVVVGSHTHCLQGVEFFDGKPVFYSLGNFIFGRDITRSAVVKLTVDAEGNASYSLIPVYASGGVTQRAADEAGESTLSYIDSISPGASVSAEGTVLEMKGGE